VKGREGRGTGGGGCRQDPTVDGRADGEVRRQMDGGKISSLAPKNKNPFL
jgi:hypothetical protein